MTRVYFLLLALAVVALDLWTKALVLARLELHDAIPVIPNLFQIVHVRNPGAAFGIGANAESRLVPFLLNGGALIVFAVVVVYALRSAVTDRVLQSGLHLILGGAVGNLIDRFRFGYVIDFLDVYAIWGGREHHWPAFNVADAAICTGIALLFLDMRKKPAEDAAAVPSAP
ncbi:MAG TPA: signal peptidase II [Thermoanaerobaculia bacterium]